MADASSPGRHATAARGADAAGPALDPYDQAGFRVRFDWGAPGLARLAPGADVVVIVDVLRFTTCVDVVLAQGATVLPYRWHDEHQAAFAAQHRAVLADSSPGAKGRAWSLSPTELSAIPAGTRLVLPSPNGAALCFEAQAATGPAGGVGRGASVMAACLRNADAVAEAICARAEGGGVVSVIAAGERWDGNGGSRFGVEDLLGAGAVIAALGDESVSPEAGVARSAWFAHRHDLRQVLVRCGSGRELAAKGFGPDVLVAAEANVSKVAPVLDGVAFTDAGTRVASG